MEVEFAQNPNVVKELKSSNSGVKVSRWATVLNTCPCCFAYSSFYCVFLLPFTQSSRITFDCDTCGKPCRSPLYLERHVQQYHMGEFVLFTYIYIYIFQFYLEMIGDLMGISLHSRYITMSIDYILFSQSIQCC